MVAVVPHALGEQSLGQLRVVNYNHHLGGMCARRVVGIDAAAACATGLGDDALNQRVENEQHAANRITASLAGLATTLLVIVIALVVIRKLQVRCLLEECMMSGQPGCVEAVDRLRVSLMFSRR